MYGMLPLLLCGQNVIVKIIKSDAVGLSEWSIKDSENQTVIYESGCENNDTISLTLEGDKRYFWEVAISDVYIPDSTISKLFINGHEIIYINVTKNSEGTYSYPFYTGIKKENKITGGSDADISNFPWQAYYISGDYQCAAVIIDEYWLVTAAHCTFDDWGRSISASKMYVKVGATDISDNSEGETYYVKNVTVHESYSTNDIVYDIALLELEEAIDIENAGAIEIVTSEDVDEGVTDPGVMSYITGWGLTSVMPEKSPDVLQKVQLPIVSNDVAAEVWGTIDESILMAGYKNGNKDACSGDSGGPLVVPIDDDEYKLAGIVSWGSSYCNTYGGYTRISGYEDWIKANAEIEENEKPEITTDDDVVCRGTVYSTYYVEPLDDAVSYDWELMTEDAGELTYSADSAVLTWNTEYTDSTARIRVRVNYSDDDVSSWAYQTIEMADSTNILSLSNDTSVCQYNPVTLSIDAEGYNLLYTWTQDNNTVQESSDNEYNVDITTLDDSGDYLCTVEGFCGTRYSASIDLIILPKTKIEYLSPDIQIEFGDTATLKVVSEGHELEYSWEKDDELLADIDSSAILFEDADFEDTGLYAVTVSGTCGTVVSDSVYVFVYYSKNNVADTTNTVVYVWPTISNTTVNIAVNITEPYNLRLYNLNGQIINNISDCQYQSEIDLSRYSAGIYFIRISGSGFNKVSKIIKVNSKY